MTTDQVDSPSVPHPRAPLPVAEVAEVLYLPKYPPADDGWLPAVTVHCPYCFRLHTHALVLRGGGARSVSRSSCPMKREAHRYQST